MHRCFLVDYERVKEQAGNGLDGIEHLTNQDTVFILFRNENISIHFQTMKKLTSSEAEIIQKVIPEASDEVMENIFSYLIGKYSQGKNTVFLVTDDMHCFEYLQSFTADDSEPAEVSAFLTIQSALNRDLAESKTAPTKATAPKGETKTKECVPISIYEALAKLSLSPDKINDIYQIINETSSTKRNGVRSMEILTGLRNMFPFQTAVEIHQVIMPLL